MMNKIIENTVKKLVVSEISVTDLQEMFYRNTENIIDNNEIYKVFDELYSIFLNTTQLTQALKEKNIDNTSDLIKYVLRHEETIDYYRKEIINIIVSQYESIDNNEYSRKGAEEFKWNGEQEHYLYSGLWDTTITYLFGGSYLEIHDIEISHAFIDTEDSLYIVFSRPQEAVYVGKHMKTYEVEKQAQQLNREYFNL